MNEEERESALDSDCVRVCVCVCVRARVHARARECACVPCPPTTLTTIAIAPLLSPVEHPHPFLSCAKSPTSTSRIHALGRPARAQVSLYDFASKLAPFSLEQLSANVSCWCSDFVILVVS